MAIVPASSLTDCAGNPNSKRQALARLSKQLESRIIRIKSPVAVSDAGSVEAIVKKIVADVRTEGDAAVRRYARAFDKSERTDFEVGRAERDAAIAELDPQTRKDTEFAIERVRAFAQA